MLNKREKGKGESILHTYCEIRAERTVGRIFADLCGCGRGSLTIEAALVLPLFLFACLALLSVMDMLTHYMDTEIKLYQTARAAAVYGYAAGGKGNGQEDWIRLKLVYPLRGYGGRFAKSLLLENHVNVHIFNGYGGDEIGEKSREDIYVYITGGSEVYHRRRDCKHLNVSVQAVSRAGAAACRNKDGGKYYPCRYCSRGISHAPADSPKVYITDYGVLYHTRIDCPDLKRRVSVVRLSEAGGRRACRDCG